MDLVESTNADYKKVFDEIGNSLKPLREFTSDGGSKMLTAARNADLPLVDQNKISAAVKKVQDALWELDRLQVAIKKMKRK